MGLLSQEYLNALLFPSPGNLSDLGIKTASPTLKVVSLNHQGSLSIVCLYNTKNILFIIFLKFWLLWVFSMVHGLSLVVMHGFSLLQSTGVLFSVNAQ